VSATASGLLWLVPSRFSQSSKRSRFVTATAVAMPHPNEGGVVGGGSTRPTAPAPFAAAVQTKAVVEPPALVAPPSPSRTVTFSVGGGASGGRGTRSSLATASGAAAAGGGMRRAPQHIEPHREPPTSYQSALQSADASPPPPLLRDGSALWPAFEDLAWCIVCLWLARVLATPGFTSPLRPLSSLPLAHTHTHMNAQVQQSREVSDQEHPHPAHLPRPLHSAPTSRFSATTNPPFTLASHGP
jgi:hypothetical protein